MTDPRSRIRTAMELGTPDRVPFMCQMSIGHMLLQLGVSPAEFWLDPEVFARGLVQLREMYAMDGILVSLHGHDPAWRSHVVSRRLGKDGEEVLWDSGEKMLCVFDDLPRVLVSTRAAPPSTEGFREADLPDTLEYIPVSQGLRFPICREHRFDIFERVRMLAGPQYSVHGEVTSPFDYYLDLFGLQQGLVGLVDSPDTARMVLRRYGSLVAGLASEMCDAGVDAIKVSSPYAGAGFISRAVYREFVLPAEREVAAAVRHRGVHIYTHTCGAINDRLEMMLDAGVSGIECLDPPPLGNVELEDAKSRLEGRGFIKGNVDSVHLLLSGTAAEILEDSPRRLETGRKGGGYIFSIACSVAPRVTRERLFLLREAVDRWG